MFISTKLSSLLLIISQVSLSSQDETTEACGDLALESIPSKYATNMMMNMQFGSVGRTQAIYEASDRDQMKAFISVVTQDNMNIDNDTTPRLVVEEMLWNPELSGVKNFLHLQMIGEAGVDGFFCNSDKVRNGSFIQWLFGYDGSQGFPSVASMLHENVQYTPGCPTVINGIPVNTYRGEWEIKEWEAKLKVKYYWSDKTQWQGSAGINRSVPVAAVMEGEATIAGRKEQMKIEIDYADFVELSLPPEFYLPKSDLWCYGRGMNDKVPEIPPEISYTEEILLLWVDEEGQPINVVLPRNVWLDHNRKLTRTDYKPIDTSNTDPFDGKKGFVSQISDVNTGLSYTINMDLGNCTIDYLTDQSGSVIIHDGHIHMENPFFDMNYDLFAFNGVRGDRSIDIDAYLRDHSPFHSTGEHNITDVFYLSSSDYEVQDGVLPERLVPTRVEKYPTKDFNKPFEKFIMNIFHFSKQSPDFSIYDVSPCFEENEKMHIMVRMGWNEAMDIENTRKIFNDEIRFAVSLWGQVNYIRIVNIEFDIDFDNSALYVIWTLLDYPKNMDVDLHDLPDAIRPLDEIKDNIKEAVDKKVFTVKVYTNDGKGGFVMSQAEPGSLRVLGDRSSGSYTHKTGYSSGSMAALGIMMLIITVAAILALLVFVLKW